MVYFYSYYKLSNLQDEKVFIEELLNPKTQNKAFQVLLQQFQRPLYHHIRTIVLNHDDADDVLQNTFIKVYKSINQFEGKSSLYTWLYKIATNETLTFLEKNKRFSYDTMEDSEDHPAIKNLKTDPLYDGDEIQFHLERAIASLPDKQKLVFKMRYYDETSYREIAEILETSEGALKASYHHAVKKIEKILEGTD